MVAIEWSDIDFAKAQMSVERSTVEGAGGIARRVDLRCSPPVTRHLCAALWDHRHRRGIKTSTVISVGDSFHPSVIEIGALFSHRALRGQ